MTMSNDKQFTEHIMEDLGWYPIRVASRHDPSEAEISAFEIKLGARLPTEYRQFIARYGQGALTQRTMVDIREACPQGQSSTIDVFLGYSTDSWLDIETATFQTYAGRIPDEAIPFALDAGGNLLLLGVAGMVRDQVWFWDHEHRETNEHWEEIVADLNAKGVETSALDEHGLIREWERLNAGRLVKARGYNNMYVVAESFSAFLQSLKPDPVYQKK